MEGLKIVLEGDPRSKKNSQQIAVNKSSGRVFVTASKAYKKFEEECLWQIMTESVRPKSPIDVSVNVQTTYYMQTRRKVDLVNLQEATLDVLVKARVLADDNSGIVSSMDGST